MERIFTSSRFSWGHEKTPAVRVVPPEMKPLLDEEGSPVVDEFGNEVLIPDTDNWEREVEEVELETLVFLDQSDQNNPTVFKFAVDKEFLARIVSYYVQFLDADGRITVREALTRVTGITEATLNDLEQLRLLEQ